MSLLSSSSFLQAIDGGRDQIRFLVAFLLVQGLAYGESRVWKVRVMDVDADDGDDRSKRPALANDSVLQWSKWQLLDSILPTGGFAHSCGLEAAIQTRIVSKPEDLQDFVILVLENAGSFLLPFVYASTTSPNAPTFYKLDRTLEAMFTNEVGRKASISQGSALMRVAASVFVEIPSLKSMRDKFLSDGSVCFHHAPTFGLVCGLLGINSETSQRAFLFIMLRDIISAATRLNVVGPLGAAVLQHRISQLAEGILQRWLNRGVFEACQTVPLLDTVQGCHGYLFSRMFCS